MKKITRLILLVVICLIPSIVLAENITKEDLISAAEYANTLCEQEEAAITNKNENGECENPINLTVLDDKITLKVTKDGQTTEYDIVYEIKSDGKIEFTSSVPVTKGMTQEQYDEAKGNSLLVLYPALLVAKAKGAKMSDYFAYFASSILTSAMNMISDPNSSTNHKYIIVADGVTLENPDDYELVVPMSEYGDYVIRIAELEFSQTSIVKDDSEEEINSYEYTGGFEKTDDEHGNIKYTLVINSNADFSKVAGLYEMLSNDNNTPGQNNSNDPTVNEPTTTEPTDTVDQQPQQKQEDNPKTGVKLQFVFLPVMIVIAIVLSRLYRRRLIQNI